MVVIRLAPHEIRTCYTGVSLDGVSEGTETRKALVSVVWIVVHRAQLEQKVLHAVPVLFSFYPGCTSCGWYSVHTFRTIP